MSIEKFLWKEPLTYSQGSSEVNCTDMILIWRRELVRLHAHKHSEKRPNENKNASCKHVNWRILIRFGPFRRKFRPIRESCFLPTIFLNGVYRHIGFHPVLDHLCMWAKIAQHVSAFVVDGHPWTSRKHGGREAKQDIHTAQWMSVIELVQSDNQNV